MFPASIQDSPLQEDDSGIGNDDDSVLGDKIGSHRAHPYRRTSEPTPQPPSPSHSLSAIIRAEIRNVFAQEDVSEPIIQMRMELPDLQNQHQESLCTANQVVSDMQTA